MRRDITAVEYVCDACELVQLVDPHNGPPYGYHGTVVWVGRDGTSNAQNRGTDRDIDWYACRETHIRGSVTAALSGAGAIDADSRDMGL